MKPFTQGALPSQRGGLCPFAQRFPIGQRSWLWVITQILPVVGEEVEACRAMALSFCPSPGQPPQRLQTLPAPFLASLASFSHTFPAPSFSTPSFFFPPLPFPLALSLSSLPALSSHSQETDSCTGAISVPLWPLPWSLVISGSPVVTWELLLMVNSGHSYKVMEVLLFVLSFYHSVWHPSLPGDQGPGPMQTDLVACLTYLMVSLVNCVTSVRCVIILFVCLFDWFWFVCGGVFRCIII